MTARPEWLEACAAQIRELEPERTADEAMELAAEMWHDRPCEEPRRCAEILIVGEA